MYDLKLPTLDNTISISPAQKEAFQKNGHTLIKNIFKHR
jgi:hypothetical protein